MDAARWLPVLLLDRLQRLYDLRLVRAHLKFTDRPLWLVILASWGVALFEYCLAVPANRIDHPA